MLKDSSIYIQTPASTGKVAALLYAPGAQLAASLMHDMLGTLGMGFSLAVFGAESGLEAGLWKLSGRDQLAALFAIDDLGNLLLGFG